MSRLGSAAPPIEISKKKAVARLEEAQQRLLRLRLILGGQVAETRIGPPLCCVFEGWDASGKGGAIKRLVAPPTSSSGRCPPCWSRRAVMTCIR